LSHVLLSRNFVTGVQSNRLQAVAAGCGACVLAVLVGGALAQPSATRGAIAVVFAFSFAAVAVVSPRRALYAIVIWLALLGLVRRVSTSIAPPGELDLLLVVAPAVFAVLLAVSAGGPSRERTFLSSLVLALAVVAALSALNPLQGGFVVGLAGLFFVLVPISAFWIGRTLFDRRAIDSLFTLVGIASVLVALYGLSQTLIGFPAWDQLWIEARRDVYASLFVGEEAIRPFSTLSSSAEYARFLGVGAVVFLSTLLAKRHIVPLVGITVLIVAITYASTRTVMVLVMAALAVMTSAWLRLSVPVATIVAIGATALVPAIANVVLARIGDGNALPQLITHQLEGLADPLNPETSTLLIHLDLVRDGLASAVSEPLGYGAGRVTLAADRFGAESLSTEADPSNVAVAFGIPGLVLYSALLLVGLYKAYRLAVTDRDRASIAAIGLLVVTLFQWLTGGEYAVAFFPWLLLGWIDARTSDLTREGRSLGDQLEAANRGSFRWHRVGLMSPVTRAGDPRNRHA
jgi:hypothetical protein